MVQVTCFALDARKVLDALWTGCCLKVKAPTCRDEIKVRRGSTRDEVKEPGWDLSTQDNGDDDGEAGSGDEDVLASLGASYRAWRAYHREKRAHTYTKSRLVDAFKREAALLKQLTPVGGSAEGVENVLMKLEDLTTSLERYRDGVSTQNPSDAASRGSIAGTNEQVLQEQSRSRETMPCGFKVLQQQCALQASQLKEAEEAILRWKTQYQQVLPKLAASNREKLKLTVELRNVKKTAVLMANRQYVHRGADDRVLEALPLTSENDMRSSKKHLHSEMKAGQSTV